MCIECGCESIGSETGIASVNLIDASTDGNAGLTLDMTATAAQRESFIEEEPVHELNEGTVDPD